MLKKVFRSSEGFTLIEVLIVVVIVAILAAISVPIYVQYVRGARAADPQSTIGAIYNAAKMYYQDKGEYPTDIDALTEEEYLNIDPATEEQWDFEIVGSATNLEQVQATSTEKMRGGAGHVVTYDVLEGRFSGYGFPVEPGGEGGE